MKKYEYNDYYENLMKRVKILVEEKIKVNMSFYLHKCGICCYLNHESTYAGYDGFEYTFDLHYREFEVYENSHRSVIAIADKIIQIYVNHVNDENIFFFK